MEREKTVVEVYALIIVVMILAITLGYMGIKLSEAQEKLEALEKDTNAGFKNQQEQIDCLQIDYESLASSTDALTQHVENLGKDLQETKQIQKNTNSALTRLRKQKEELEKRFEEELELRKQRLAELQARWSAPSTGWSDAGGFLLTAYEWTGKTCANGNYPTVGYTCASNYYPLGTRLWIEGIGERVVEDTGGMGMNVVDIYMGDEETCIQFGVQEAQITVIEE